MNNSSDSDDELLQKARRAPDADLWAFEQLVHRYQRKVVANCRYLTKDAGYAEDLAQEVFVKAFFGLARFEGRSSFRTWLQRIKINHCLNFLKKQVGKAFVSVEDDQLIDARELVQEPAAERAVLDRSERERITAILDSMSDNLRIPLLMRDMDQLSYEEVAKALNISLSAAKMRIKRGREEFQKRYRDMEGDMHPRNSSGR